MVTERSVSGEQGFRAYRHLFAGRPARRFFVASIPGRFGVATVSLAAIVFTQVAVGSYQLAGVAAGVLSISNAVIAPVTARIAARHGQAVVLRVSALSLMVAATALTAVTWCSNVALLLVSVALIGAAMPQFGAIAVSRWSALVTTPAMLRTALAVESMMTEVTFLAGPAGISLIVSVWGAAVAPGVAAILIVLSALLLAASRDSEPPRTTPSRRGGVSRRPTLPLVFMAATNVAIGCFFGASQVSVIAAVTHLGNISIATAVYGVMSITSLVAGLTYGAIRRRASHTVWDLTGGFLGLCLSAIALAQARGLLLLAILLLISGVFVAPTIITTGVIAERATPPEHVHSTFTVLTSLQGLGIAVGAATAGTLIDGGGSTRGFVVAAVATGLGAAAAIACAFSSTRGEGVSDK